MSYYRVPVSSLSGMELWLPTVYADITLEGHRRYNDWRRAVEAPGKPSRKRRRKARNRLHKLVPIRFYFVPEEFANRPGAVPCDFVPPPLRPFFGVDRSVTSARLAGFKEPEK